MINRYKRNFVKNSLKQLIRCPTRVPCNISTLIDHIFTNSTEKTFQSGIIDPGISDHKLLFCTRKVKRVKFHKGTVKKYVRSRFPSFDPSSPLVCPFSFSSTPPPPKVRLFWLELTLSPSISILEKFREKKLIISTIVSLVELNVSFKKP